MIRFLSMELVRWAFISRQLIPIHEYITILIGPNGSGKTSFLDAFKTLLGGKRLYKNKTMKDYMQQPGSTEAYIIGRLDNSPVNGRSPFSKLGYQKPIVTIICKIALDSDGSWRRNYAFYDGEFWLEEDLSKIGTWYGLGECCKTPLKSPSIYPKI